MIRHHTCVTVHCATEKCDSWDEGALHFPDEAEALAYVLGEDGLGWRQWPDGRLLCRGCSEVADCAQAGGHTYGEWRERQRWDADAGRSVPVVGGVQWRSCRRCGGGFQERIES